MIMFTMLLLLFSEDRMDLYLQCCYNDCKQLHGFEPCKCLQDSHKFLFCSLHFDCSFHEINNITPRPEELGIKFEAEETVEADKEKGCKEDAKGKSNCCKSNISYKLNYCI